MGDFGEEFWDISGVTFGRITVLNEYQGLYVATGIVQRRDVSILYSVIITSSHNIITKDTSCSNKSISCPELWAGHEAE